MNDETISIYQNPHYKILEKLGEGGMGVVYKAQDLLLDRLVALKFLPHHFGHEAEQKQRFIQEAKAASALDHPNIRTIYEIDEAGEGQLFIAMVYYEGETLKGRIERGPLPVEEAAGLAQQIAQGLAKAHSQGLVHRDIKPVNVMITRDGVVKIVDFGLARMAGGAWNEPVYMLTDADAQSPIDRSANFGFRCVKYASPDSVSTAAAGDVASITNRAFEKEKPVSDEVFRAYRSPYSYDKTPLNATSEPVDEINPDWRREKITLAAADGKERVSAYLFVPKKSAPPFQTVVFFPGSGVIAVAAGVLRCIRRL